MIRCRRYAAMFNIQKFKEDAVMAYEGIYNMENDYKKKEILKEMFDDDGNQTLDKYDEQMEIMNPYYNHVELIAGLAIGNQFGGHVQFALETKNQKEYSAQIKGMKFLCFVDGYQHNDEDDHFNIFEVKSTTTSKFKKLKYKEDKIDHMIFYEDEGGIFRLNENNDPYLLKNKKYMNQRNKLVDRFTDVGKYVHDLAFQRYVIEKYHETTGKPKPNADYYLAVINADYIFDGSVDEYGGQLYDDDLIRFIDLTAITGEMMAGMQREVDDVLDYIDNNDMAPVKLGSHCQKGKVRECKYFDICWKDVPVENSIFDYMYNHHGFKDESGVKHDRWDLINEGITTMEQIPHSWLSRDNNKIQRDVVLTGNPYYNFEKLKDAIKLLKYPIYHLDFETFPCPLPRFSDEKAYTQSLFQYSLHIEREAGVCDKDKDHIGFLSYDQADRRREMVVHMLDHIKDDDGSILVYNDSFEKGRIKEMMKLYPELAPDLQRIHDRVFDLMNITKGSSKLFESLGYDKKTAKGITFYHGDLHGSYSIKKVLPIFSDLSYEGMGVGNGTEAFLTYANFPNMTEKEFKKSYQDLIDYCKQDTWAMVEILDKFRQILK